MIPWNQNVPEDDPAWDNPRAIAKILNTKYPRTDVLSLTDAKLLAMMRDTGILDKLSEPGEDKQKDNLFVIKCALSREIESSDQWTVVSGQ